MADASTGIRHLATAPARLARPHEKVGAGLGPDPRLLDLSAIPIDVADEIADHAYRRAAQGKTDRLWRPHQEETVGDLEERAAAHGRSILRSAYEAIARKLRLPGELTDYSRWELDEQARFSKATGVGLFARMLGLRDLDDYTELVSRVFDYFAPAGAETRAAQERVLHAFLAGMDRDALSRLRRDMRLTRIDRYPVNLSIAGRQFRLNADRLNEVRWMQAMGAENVRGWNDDARSSLRKMLVRSQAQKWSPSKLERELFDKFGDLSMDWRRIAISEQNEAVGQGFVAGLPFGTIVRRLEAPDACLTCRRFHGREFTVVDPNMSNKDGDRQVWAGKVQGDRQAAPRKRVATVLVPRSKDELWWCPAGTVHPSCRGGFEIVRRA